MLACCEHKEPGTKKVDFTLDVFSLISALLVTWLAVCFLLEGGRDADPSAGPFFQDLCLVGVYRDVLVLAQWQSFDQLKQLIRTGGVAVNTTPLSIENSTIGRHVMTLFPWLLRAVCSAEEELPWWPLSMDIPEGLGILHLAVMGQVEIDMITN